MAAARDKDVLDLKVLLRGVADRSRVREIVERHLGRYAARELDRLVEEVDWETSREES